MENYFFDFRLNGLYQRQEGEVQLPIRCSLFSL